MCGCLGPIKFSCDIMSSPISNPSLIGTSDGLDTLTQAQQDHAHIQTTASAHSPPAAPPDVPAGRCGTNAPHNSSVSIRRCPQRELIAPGAQSRHALRVFEVRGGLLVESEPPDGKKTTSHCKCIYVQQYTVYSCVIYSIYILQQVI